MLVFGKNSIFKKCGKTILDTLFPIFCLGCQKEGEWICQNCHAFIEPRLINLCPKQGCHKETSFGETCQSCRKYFPLSGLLSFVSYKDPIISSSIKIYKYYGIKALEDFLTGFLSSAIMKWSTLVPRGIIVPVPIHWWRERGRGFNQAERLAQVICEGTGEEIVLALKRRYYTLSQTKLDEQDRRLNVKNAFQCISKERVIGKSVVLVDDVYTTGETMQECARTLIEAGASEVWGITIARG